MEFLLYREVPPLQVRYRHIEEVVLAVQESTIHSEILFELKEFFLLGLRHSIDFLFCFSMR